MIQRKKYKQNFLHFPREMFKLIAGNLISYWSLTFLIKTVCFGHLVRLSRLTNSPFFSPSAVVWVLNAIFKIRVTDFCLESNRHTCFKSELGRGKTEMEASGKNKTKSGRKKKSHKVLPKTSPGNVTANWSNRLFHREIIYQPRIEEQNRRDIQNSNLSVKQGSGERVMRGNHQTFWSHDGWNNQRVTT